MAGVSGAGKSTLSAALVQSGFDHVSDDWTDIGRCGGRVLAHGMSPRIKLLPDAIAHFPLLAEHSLITSLNGELAYEVAADSFGGDIFRSCEPRRCIFLERSSQFTSSFAPMGAEQVRLGFQASVERLPSQLADAARARVGDHRPTCLSFLLDVSLWGHSAVCREEILASVCSQKQELTA